MYEEFDNDRQSFLQQTNLQSQWEPQPPTKSQLQKNARKLYNSAGFAFLLYYALAYVISFFVGLAIAWLWPRLGFSGSPRLTPSMESAFNCILTLCINLLAFLFFKRRFQIKARSFCSVDNLKMNDVIKGSVTCLGINSLASIVLSMILGILSMLFHVSPTTPDFSLSGNLVSDIWLVITIVLVAPITEEYVFRGILQSGFARYGKLFSLVAPAALFALLHGNVIQAIPTFFVGFYLGYVTYKTGSIATSVCIHMFNNLIALLMSLPFIPSVVSGIYVLAMIFLAVALFLTQKNIVPLPENNPAIPSYLRWKTMVTSPVMVVVLAIFAYKMFASLI